MCKKHIKIDLGGVSQLNTHATSAKHKKLYSSNANQQTFVTNSSDNSVSLSKAKKIILSEEDAAVKAEIIACLNAVNYNHSFASANLNGECIGLCFPIQT